MEQIFLAGKAFFLVQVLCLCLKCDDLLAWHWKEVFWSYWIFFSVLIGLTFGVFLLFVSKLSKCILSNGQAFEVLGLLWLFFLSLGSVITSSGLVLGIIYFKDSDEDILLRITLVFAESFAGLVVVSTFFLKNPINKFFLHIAGAGDDSDSNSSTSNDSISQRNREMGGAEEKTQRILLPPQKLSIPIFLVSSLAFGGLFTRLEWMEWSMGVKRAA